VNNGHSVVSADSLFDVDLVDGVKGGDAMQDNMARAAYPMDLQ